jgi:hypothetical protein
LLLRLIACNVFMREACLAIAESPHTVDPDFTELGAHINSDSLRAIIQERIDAADTSGKAYDAILLLFGLCGNAGVGLHARHQRLVIPRAHDCCTILLGSQGAFREHFGDEPSTPFSSAGYMERGDYYLRVDDGETKVVYGDAFAEYVEKYGEENARYIWDTMHPDRSGQGSNRAVYIDSPEMRHLGYADRFRAQAEADGKEYVHVDGSLRLIRNLLLGQWDATDFLVVEPGQRTSGVYDWVEVVRAEG